MEPLHEPTADLWAENTNEPNTNEPAEEAKEGEAALGEPYQQEQSSEKGEFVEVRQSMDQEKKSLKEEKSNGSMKNILDEEEHLKAERI